MSLGNSLASARKKSGLSQEEVAAKLGVSRQTISKWETEVSQRSRDQLCNPCLQLPRRLCSLSGICGPIRCSLLRSDQPMILQ